MAGKGPHTRYTQVTCKSELQPTTESRSVNSRDSGHWEALKFAERSAQVGEELGYLAFGHRATFCQIGTRAE